MEDVKKPVNTTDEYMYAMVIRLDALCHMVSSLVDHIAEKENIAVENNEVKEKKPAPRKKATSTKK